MPKRDLVLYPNDVLRGRAARVVAWPDRKLIADMWDTMHAYQGCGLAAPQIGVDLQVAVVAVEGVELVMANPALRHRSLADRTVGSEGCLSCPDDIRWVERFANVTVECLDAEGSLVRVEAGGMLAVALQHELDHLQGKLIIDHSDLRTHILHKENTS